MSEANIALGFVLYCLLQRIITIRVGLVEETFSLLVVIPFFIYKVDVMRFLQALFCKCKEGIELCHRGISVVVWQWSHVWVVVSVE